MYKKIPGREELQVQAAILIAEDELSDGDSATLTDFQAHADALEKRVVDSAKDRGTTWAEQVRI